MPIYNCTDKELEKVLEEMNQEVANGELNIYCPVYDGPFYRGLIINLGEPNGIRVHAMEVYEKFVASHDDPVVKTMKSLLKEWYPRARKAIDEHKVLS